MATINSLVTSSSSSGVRVTINGSGFGSSGTIALQSPRRQLSAGTAILMTTTTWSDTYIQATLPHSGVSYAVQYQFCLLDGTSTVFHKYFYATFPRYNNIASLKNLVPWQQRTSDDYLTSGTIVAKTIAFTAQTPYTFPPSRQQGDIYQSSWHQVLSPNSTFYPSWSQTAFTVKATPIAYDYSAGYLDVFDTFSGFNNAISPTLVGLMTSPGGGSAESGSYAPGTTLYALFSGIGISSVPATNKLAFRNADTGDLVATVTMSNVVSFDSATNVWRGTFVVPSGSGAMRLCLTREGTGEGAVGEVASFNAKSIAITPPLPDPPTGLDIYNEDKTTADLSWVNGAYATTVYIYADGILHQANQSGTTYHFSGLSPDTTYVITMKSWNSTGLSVESDPVLLTTLPDVVIPPIDPYINMDSRTTDSITLTFGGTGATLLTLTRPIVAPPGFEVLYSGAGPTHTMTIENLLMGSQYQFDLAANNGSTTEYTSATYGTEALFPEAKNLRLLFLDSTTATIEWDLYAAWTSTPEDPIAYKVILYDDTLGTSSETVLPDISKVTTINNLFPGTHYTVEILAKYIYEGTEYWTDSPEQLWFPATPVAPTDIPVLESKTTDTITIGFTYVDGTVSFVDSFIVRVYDMTDPENLVTTYYEFVNRTGLALDNLTPKHTYHIAYKAKATYGGINGESAYSGAITVATNRPVPVIFPEINTIDGITDSTADLIIIAPYPDQNNLGGMKVFKYNFAPEIEAYEEVDDILIEQPIGTLDLALNLTDIAIDVGISKYKFLFYNESGNGPDSVEYSIWSTPVPKGVLKYANVTETSAELYIPMSGYANGTATLREVSHTGAETQIGHVDFLDGATFTVYSLTAGHKYKVNLVVNAPQMSPLATYYTDTPYASVTDAITFYTTPPAPEVTAANSPGLGVIAYSWRNDWPAGAGTNDWYWADSFDIEVIENLATNHHATTGIINHWELELPAEYTEINPLEVTTFSKTIDPTTPGYDYKITITASLTDGGVVLTSQPTVKIVRARCVAPTTLHVISKNNTQIVFGIDEVIGAQWYEILCATATSPGPYPAIDGTTLTYGTVDSPIRGTTATFWATAISQWATSADSEPIEVWVPEMPVIDSVEIISAGSGNIIRLRGRGFAEITNFVVTPE